MSRIGKKTIAVPSGVTVTLDGQAIRVKGPKGELSHTLPEEISIGQADGQLILTPMGESQRHNAMWGLSRTLTNNMVEGVTKGYEEVLELVGVGYRAALKGRDLSLQLGFSHDVDMPPPAGITFAVPKPRRDPHQRHRQAAGRRDGRAHPPRASARALQGQGRALPGRDRAAQGRQEEVRWPSPPAKATRAARSATASAFARSPASACA